MTDFATYVHYFRQIHARHYGIANFQHGDAPDIIKMERRGANYPLLWLESPLISFSRGVPRFRGAFMILAHAGTPDRTRYDYYLAKCYAIAVDIISEMRRDNEKGYIHFDVDKSTLFPHYFGTDNQTGWRVEFEVATGTGFCETGQFDNTYLSGTASRFMWNVASATEIEIVDKSERAEGFTHQTKYQIDRDPGVVIGPQAPGIYTIPAGWRSINMHMESINGALTFYSSWVIENIPGAAGFSVPYLYKKHV